MDFEEASKRQFGRSVMQLKPDLKEYNALKQKLVEDKFYVTAVTAPDSPAGDAPSSLRVSNGLN